MRGVGEKAERQSAGCKRQNSFFILEHRRSVACIDIGKRIDGLIKTSEKSGSAYDSACSRHDGAVHLQQQPGDGFRVFKISTSEQALALRAEHVLSGCRDVQGSLPLSCDIEEHKQQFRFNSEKVVEISADARSAIDRRNFG